MDWIGIEMHELSIAHDLVEIAEAAARDAHASRVEVVYLSLGLLSGVVKDALLFAYDLATAGTLLAGSRLEIEEVPVTIYCPDCARIHTLPSIQVFQCPVCGRPGMDIRSGREIQINSMEIMSDEPETETAGN